MLSVTAFKKQGIAVGAWNIEKNFNDYVKLLKAKKNLFF